MNLPICTGSNRKIKYTACFVILILLLVIFFTISVCAGSVSISVADIWGQLTGEGDELYTTILFQIRIPRTLAAILLGGALALSGYLLQTFFHNPIAGPFVLGISSGAKLFVAVVMIVFLKWSRTLSSVDLIVAAFLGSMLSMFCVLLMSPKISDMSCLVLIGVMIGYICSAVTDFLVTFAEDSDIVNLHNWSMGSFSGITWENVKTILLVVAVTGIMTFFLSKPMEAYQLGETYAKNMGVNIRLFRVLLVLLSSILSAVVTAFAGPVSFVGIAVPQIMKRFFQTAKPIVMIPACL